MMRKPFIAVMVACLSLAQVNDARACKCAPPPPVATAVETASAVFAGKIAEVSTGSDEQNPMIAKLAVSKVWKGPVGATIDVRTPTSSAACGLSFAQGTEWLIYADTTDGKLSANHCSRSKPLESAGEDLAELGFGTAPGGGGPPPEPPSARGCACELAQGGAAPWGALAALAAAGAVAIRRRRRA